MAERSFSDLLNIKFRWPTEGDALFRAAEDGMDDAIISGTAGSRLIVMASGYRMAADELVEQSRDSGRRDFLVYPIIFCYRQFLELHLKWLLLQYGPEVGVRPIWNSHDLKRLAEQFFKMLDEYGGTKDDDAGEVVYECLLEFAKIDPGSYSFRYSVTSDGKPMKVAVERIDLVQMKDVIRGIDGYFSGTDGWLDNLTGA